MRYLALALLLTACNSAPHSSTAETTACPLPAQVAPPPAPTNCATWTAHFSPRGGATDNVVNAINQAQTDIYVQAYSFTSEPIASALIGAHQRGKYVEVLLDKSDRTGKGSLLSALVNGGVKVLVDDKHAIAHNKIIIIDRKIVFTGSFNFTKAAEFSNAENSLELTDVNLANVYLGNWQFHKQHSVPVQ